MGYDVLCNIIQTLERGCASQAWTYMVLADNPLKLATFSKRTQDEVWDDDDTQRVGVAVGAVGRQTLVDGGILWSGTDGFCSGIDHVQWLICGGFIEHKGTLKRCRALIPKMAVSLADDWHVVGLVGTDSKSFSVDKAFFPAHRIISKSVYGAGMTLGSQIHNSAVFRMLRGGGSAASYAAVAVGAAQGMLSALCEYTAPRKSRGKAVTK